jgi:CelD/BcsL family acetyltransferase involved in cellulose biosynthesis
LKNLVEQTRFSFQLHKHMEPLEAVWRSLEAAPECSIHQTYDWCRTWIRQTDCEPLIVTASFSGGTGLGDTAFILPLMVVKRGPIKIARYVSAPFNNINFGVFSPRFLDIVTAELMADVRRQLITLPLGVDVIDLDRQPETWRGAPHPFAYFQRTENQNHAFQVTLAGGFDAVLAHGNAKRRRKKFRTSERRLEELGGYEHVKAQTNEEARTLLDAFFQQKSVRFELHGLPDAFAADDSKAFFHKLAEDSIGQDRKLIDMQGIRLANGSVCAVSALSHKGGHVICQFSSIGVGETEHASPGELLFYLMIRDACEAGAEIFDFGIGDEQFKRSWCNVETLHYDTIIAVTPLGHLAAAAARIVVACKRITKSNPTMFRWAKALRFSFRR